MESAIRKQYSGIEAECGGACACATCHVYVDEGLARESWRPFLRWRRICSISVTNVRPKFSSVCQIKVTDDLDGLSVSTPDKQAKEKRKSVRMEPDKGTDLVLFSQRRDSPCLR